MKNLPSNWTNLKVKVDKLDARKLVPVPVSLCTLNAAVKNDIVKKDVYNAQIKDIEDKMPGIINLAIKATLNARINEVIYEILNITNLANTTTALAAVSNLVKKLTITQKFMKLKRKLLIIIVINIWLRTQELNKLTLENFAARLAQANLASKNDIANFAKKTDLDDKLKNLNKNVISNKKNMYLLRMNLMNRMKIWWNVRKKCWKYN